MSSALRAVRPFIGSVDASTSVAPAGAAGDRAGGQHEAVAVAAVLALRHDDRHDPVADGEVGVGVGADLVDDAGHVHAGDVRRLEVLEHLVARPVAGERVGRVDRRRVHADAHLTRPGVAVRQLEHPQRLRPAVPTLTRHPDDSHPAVVAGWHGPVRGRDRDRCAVSPAAPGVTARRRRGRGGCRPGGRRRPAGRRRASTSCTRPARCRGGRGRAAPSAR